MALPIAAIFASAVPAIVNAVAEKVGPNAKAVAAGVGAAAAIITASPEISPFPTESLGYLLGWSEPTTRHVGALIAWAVTTYGVWRVANRPKPE